MPVGATAGPGAVVVGGDYQGLGIVRSLGRRGVRTFVLDDERSISRVSRYADRTERVRSLRSKGATLQALHSVRRRYGLDGWVVYPTREETVAAIAGNREELAEWFRIPTPCLDTVRAAWDKRLTYRLAERLDVATPRTWFPSTEDDLDQVDVSTPVVVKPAIKEHFVYATKAKAWRADTEDELHETFRRAAGIVGPGEIIVQELVPGAGEAQYAYCALFANGQPVAAMTVRRLRQHPSDFGKASTYVETVDEPALEKPSVRFLAETGYYGLVELEYKCDPRDGVFKLLDVNARTWGYHSLGAAAGVDFPYLLYRHQLGERIEPSRARAGVRWVRLATDIPNAFVDWRAHRLRAGAYLRTLRGVDTEAVFSLRDPLPGLYELALLPYLFVKRGL